MTDTESSSALPKLSDMGAQGVNPVSRSRLIADAIRTAILTGELKSGQALVERDLAAMLRVSKTPIREALKTLEHSGLVETAAFRGASVRAVDRPLVHAIYDARLVVEPAAVGKSVQFHTGRTLADARSALQEAWEAGEARDYAQLSLKNRDFHRRLYAECGNPVLVFILDHVQDLVGLISVYSWQHEQSWEAEAAEHAAVLHAVETGDAANAAELVQSHVAGALTRLDRTFDDPHDCVSLAAAAPIRPAVRLSMTSEDQPVIEH